MLSKVMILRERPLLITLPIKSRKSLIVKSTKTQVNAFHCLNIAAELCLSFNLKTIGLSQLGGITMEYREYALIPARGGSRGVPRKNLAVIGTKTLLERTIETALACNVFHKIIVSSDDYEILNLALNYQVDIHQRSAWASADYSTASVSFCKAAPHCVLIQSILVDGSLQ